jgi:hypothetical protein
MFSCGKIGARLFPIFVAHKINFGRTLANCAGSAISPDFARIFFAESAENLAWRGFRQSGLRKILLSKNLDIKILRTNDLAGEVSR